MFRIVTLKDVVRMPPSRFYDPLDEVAMEMLRKKYEGYTFRDLGLIIAVLKLREISPEGVIIPGDGATYHKVIFDLLSYMPILHEVVEGEVIDVESFGTFVRIGPHEALIHKSQVYDDKFEYDHRERALIGRGTHRVLRRGDMVRARVVSVSVSGGIERGGRGMLKVGLTMRQPLLGKLEWIEEEIRRIQGRM